MKHPDWAREMKSALGCAANQPEVAVARLRKLAVKSRREARLSIGSWHVEQALGGAASTLTLRGQHAEAANVYRALVRAHRDHFQHYGHALANAFAFAALELFAAGESRRAAPLALEALRYFGQFPEASITYEQLVRALREHPPKRPRRGRRSGA